MRSRDEKRADDLVTHQASVSGVPYRVMAGSLLRDGRLDFADIRLDPTLLSAVSSIPKIDNTYLKYHLANFSQILRRHETSETRHHVNGLIACQKKIILNAAERSSGKMLSQVASVSESGALLVSRSGSEGARQDAMQLMSGAVDLCDAPILARLQGTWRGLASDISIKSGLAFETVSKDLWRSGRIPLGDVRLGLDRAETLKNPIHALPSNVFFGRATSAVSQAIRHLRSQGALKEDEVGADLDAFQDATTGMLSAFNLGKGNLSDPAAESRVMGSLSNLAERCGLGYAEADQSMARSFFIIASSAAQRSNLYLARARDPAMRQTGSEEIH